MRIDTHPIIGRIEKGRMVEFELDGMKMNGYEGEPIAMALKAAGIQIHRYTSARDFLCNWKVYGLCNDCRWKAEYPHLCDSAERRNEGADTVRRLGKTGGVRT